MLAESCRVTATSQTNEFWRCVAPNLPVGTPDLPTGENQYGESCQRIASRRQSLGHYVTEAAKIMSGQSPRRQIIWIDNRLSRRSLKA
jgi:hypothetical protein